MILYYLQEAIVLPHGMQPSGETAMSAAVYVLRQANGTSTRQTTKQGYFDATAMCQAWSKKFNDYARLQSTKEFLEELKNVTGIPATDLVIMRQGGSPHLQGTWVHRRVAYHLAQWCSPAFAVMVSGWIDEWVAGNQPSMTQFDQRMIVDTLEQHSAKIQSLAEKQLQFDRRIIRLENTTRRNPNPAQVKLLCRVVCDWYGGMDPAQGKHRVVDPSGNRLPHSEIDHFNELRHDNRTQNLWLIHPESHQLKTAGTNFLAEFRVFQNRLQQLNQNAPTQMQLFA